MMQRSYAINVENPMQLRNTYWLIRHGHSKANALDLIVSSLHEGLQPQWGLSELGHQQSDGAGEELLRELGTFDPARLLIFTSPFSRTLETAARVGSHLEVHLHDPRMVRAPELRERFFGAYDMASTSAYESVWADDAKGTELRPPGDGESVDDVASRLAAFVEGVEARHSGHSIVLVSHGDALSILAAVLLGTDLREHRSHGLPNCGILRVPKVPAAVPHPHAAPA